MAAYDDDVILLDDTGITIHNYYLPGRPRHITYDDIEHAEPIKLGYATGRLQLVGVGPFRPRLFFHWDRKRRAKLHGLSLDLGKRLLLATTPDDPNQVLEVIHRNMRG